MARLISHQTSALLWLRWRLMLRALQSFKKKGAASALSQILSFVPLLISGLIFIPIIILLTGGFAYGGWMMAQSRGPSPFVITLFRVLLTIMMLSVLLGPFLRSFQGGRLDWQRLRLLPISRWVWFRGELLASFTEPWLFGFIPPCVALSVGLLVGGALPAALWSFFLLLAFFYCMGALGAFSTLATSLILRDRRRTEAIGLVLLLVAVLAPLLLTFLENESSNASSQADTQTPDYFFRWFTPFPSDLAARGIRAVLDPRIRSAFPHLSYLIVWSVLLTFFAYRVFLRIQAGPPTSMARRSARAERNFGSIPGLECIVQSIARAQTITYLRTVRGKLALLICPPLVIVFYFSVIQKIPEVEWASALPHGPALFFFATAFHALTMPSLPLSTVCADGPGWTLQWLSPASARQLVLGKLLGMSTIYIISYILCGALALILSPTGSVATWLAIAVAGLAAWVVSAPITFILGLLLPKRIDPNQLGKTGNPHPFANLLGTFLFSIGFAPGSLIMLELLVEGNVRLHILLVQLVWLGVAFVIAHFLLNIAANLLETRFEALRAILREG